MKASDLRPAYEFAQSYGVKAICYGPPGTGKTPAISSAPRPILCAIEPGMLSMRGSNVPTWQADTPERIEEFFKFLAESSEAKNFDTIGIDSASEMAEVFLNEELGKKSKSGNKVNGEAAYGEMATRTYEKLNQLFFTKEKNVYLICKQALINEGTEDAPIIKKRPHFPGKVLNVKVPHLYDEILHLAEVQVPQVGKVKAFRTRESFDVMARDRSGKLGEYEPTDLSALFAKCMSN